MLFFTKKESVMPPYSCFHNLHRLYKIILQFASLRTIAISLLPLLVSFIIPAPLVQADGCAFPPAAVKKIPEIPIQRAVLTWRDGQERMVIESTFKSEGERLGWVVPVPAAPTRFEAVTPGFAGQLEFITRPRVIHSSMSFFFADHKILLLASLFIFLGCVSVCFRLDGLSWHLLVTLIVFFGFTLAFLIGPTLGGGGSGVKPAGNPAITIEKQSRVGNYQIEVLNAQTPKALSDWLSAHSFAPLTAESEPIVRQLIAEKWRFVAATLQRTGQGLLTPHPLALTFPAKDLVYPMRLTGLTGSPVYLEIFTVAERQASTPLIQTEYCNQFDELPMHAFEVVGKDNPRPEMSIVDHGEKFGMWSGCTLTRMTGTLTPAQMRSDLAFTWKEPKAYRRNFYSRAGAASLALAWALLAWCCGAGCLLLDRTFNTWNTRKAAVAPDTDHHVFRRATLAIAAGALLIGFIVYPFLPKTAVQTTLSVPKQNAALISYLKMADIIEGCAAEQPDEKLEKLIQRIDQSFEKKGTLRHVMADRAAQDGRADRKDYELLENADGSVDYVITMPDGTPWGSRLRKSEREQAEEEMNKMLEKMNVPQ